MNTDVFKRHRHEKRISTFAGRAIGMGVSRAGVAFKVLDRNDRSAVGFLFEDRL